MNTLHRKLYQTSLLDVRRNLAIEECLLTKANDDDLLLFLWRSTPCVVIGKNQNPWLECRLDLLNKEGAHLARRLSGGGAVYHDPGNLNYSFFVARDRYDRTQLADVILRGLESLGIPASIGERDIIEVDGRKVSGSAFCYRRTRVLHHGTLLVEADLLALDRYLKPTCPGLESRGIASVPSPVTNLACHVPGLDTEQVANAIARAFGVEETTPLPDPGDLPAKYESPDWLFGRTPRFTCNGKVAGTTALFNAIVSRGVVTELATTPTEPAFEQKFIGSPFGEFLKHNPQFKVG